MLYLYLRTSILYTTNSKRQTNNNYSPEDKAEIHIIIVVNVVSTNHLSVFSGSSTLSAVFARHVIYISHTFLLFCSVFYKIIYIVRKLGRFIRENNSDKNRYKV